MKRNYYVLVFSLLVIYFPLQAQEHLSISTGLNLPVDDFNKSFRKNGGAAKPGYVFNLDYNTMLFNRAGIGITAGHSINAVKYSKMNFEIDQEPYYAKTGENYRYYYAMPYIFLRFKNGHFFHDIKLKGGVINITYPKTRGFLYISQWAFNLNYNRDTQWAVAFIPSFTTGFQTKKLVFSIDVSYMDFNAKHTIKRPRGEIETDQGVFIGYVNFPNDKRTIHYQNLTFTIGAGFKL